MKIKSVELVKESVVAEVIVKNKVKRYELQLSMVTPQVSVSQISNVKVSKDTGKTVVEISLRDKSEPIYIHIDEFLEVAGDPEYIRDNLLYDLTVELIQISKVSQLTKKEIAKELKTSEAQIYRIFDTTNYSKSIDQVIKVLAVYKKFAIFNIMPISATKVDRFNNQPTKFRSLRKVSSIQ